MIMTPKRVSTRSNFFDKAAVTYVPEMPAATKKEIKPEQIIASPVLVKINDIKLISTDPAFRAAYLAVHNLADYKREAPVPILFPNIACALDYLTEGELRCTTL